MTLAENKGGLLKASLNEVLPSWQATQVFQIVERIVKATWAVPQTQDRAALVISDRYCRDEVKELKASLNPFKKDGMTYTDAIETARLKLIQAKAKSPFKRDAIRLVEHVVPSLVQNSPRLISPEEYMQETTKKISDTAQDAALWAALSDPRVLPGYNPFFPLLKLYARGAVKIDFSENEGIESVRFHFIDSETRSLICWQEGQGKPQIHPWPDECAKAA